jgi:hypothetical protein
MPQPTQTEEVAVPRPRPIHRQALALAMACLLLAVLAVSAPAATRDEMSGPDARALAQEHYYGSYAGPAQDLRSPDAREPMAPVADDGIAPLPLVLVLVGTAIVGAGISTAARARRRVAA